MAGKGAKNKNSGGADRRVKLKKNMRWSKLVDLLINFLSILIMLYAGAFAIAKEISWPFILIVAIECPFWIILARKLFWEDKPIVGWIVRGVVLIAGYVFLSISVQHCVYNRCFPSVAKDNFQSNFTENVKTDTMEYQDMGEIATEIKGDYTELKAVISYKNTEDGSTGTEEMTMYFDRLNGKYYESLDELEEYRQQVKDMNLNLK